MILSFDVSSDCELKSFLLENGFSKRQVSCLLLEKDNIFINGKVYEKDFLLNKGDKVKITLNEKTTVNPVDKPIDVFFEDEYLLVVIKESGLVVIPSKAHFFDSLAGRVLNYFNQKNENCGIHVVNRLDKDTSGLVIFAKSSFVHFSLSKTEIIKKYKALVSGVLERSSGEINAKIIKSNSGIKREISEKGQSAKTLYKVIGVENENSLVDIELKTGRTHQIRVHFKSINHPLVGDTLYGGSKGRFYLNCYYMSFVLPINNKRYEFCC